MKTAYYFRVASQEQLNENEQRALVKKEAENRTEIKTVFHFADGTSKVLSPSEIKGIFESFLRGDRLIHIDKPKKEFDYVGKLRYMEVNNGESNHICKKHL